MQPCQTTAGKTTDLPLLLLAMVVMAVCNLQLLSENWFPVHDNMSRYWTGHIFYESWLFNGLLPHWFPYLNYGVTSYHFQYSAITPFGYLVGWLGAMAEVSQPLALFKAQQFLESEIFTIGLAMLSMRLFSQGWTRAFVVLCGVLSLAWWFQPCFNFYSYYAIPWILFYLHRFFSDNQPADWWRAGFICVISQIGNVAYFIPITGWTLAVITLPLWWANPAAFRTLFCRQSWIPLLALLTLMALIGWALLHAMDELNPLLTGRDKDTLHVTLQSFLTYGRYSLPEVLRLMINGDHNGYDISLYIGWIPWLLFGYGLVYVRHPWFTGLAIAIALWTWTAMGDLFATAIFQLLPGINVYRHLSHLISFVKILVLIASGFGLQHLQQRLAKTGPPSPVAFGPLLPYALGLIPLMLLDIAHTSLGKEYDSFSELFFYLAHFVSPPHALVYGVTAILVFFGSRGPHRSKVSILLVTVALLDMGHYRWQVAQEEHSILTKPIPRQALSVTVPPYVPQRTPFQSKFSPPTTPIDTLASWMLDHRPPGYSGEMYNHIYQGLGEDSCFTALRFVALAKPVFLAIRVRGGHPSWFSRNVEGENYTSLSEYLPPNDTAFHRSLGCGTDKLRLYKRAIFTENTDQAVAQFLTLANPDEVLVLEGAHPPTATLDGPASADPGTIQVTDYSPLHLQLAVTNPDQHPVWLYYADAYHPGWQASVDGQHQPIFRANLGFKAIPIPPGVHQVVWQFKDGLRARVSQLVAIIGLTAALLAIVGLLSGFVTLWREAPKPPDVA